MKRGAGIAGHGSAQASARSSAVANLPPPSPSVPTKSVSQNWQSAVGAILLAAGPQIAAGKAAEDGGAPGVRALALQRVENLFDGVHARIPNRLHAGIQA